jgi:predicted nicotinamide N-methyase
MDPPELTDADLPQPGDLVEETIALRGRALALLRPRDSEELLDERAFEHEEFLPYWAELWPSGVALARALDGRALRGTRVVELGCGLGLPSIVAALAGGQVLATDWSHQAVDFAADNAARNDARIETAVIDWTKPDALVARGPFGLVLAADVLYERRNVGPLLDLLPLLVAPGGEVWLADPGRAPAETFLRLADADGWRRRSTADPARPNVQVHRLSRADADVDTA